MHIVFTACAENGVNVLLLFKWMLYLRSSICQKNQAHQGA